MPRSESNPVRRIPERHGTHQRVNIPKFTQLPPIGPRAGGAPTQGAPQPSNRAEAGTDPTSPQAPLEGNASSLPAQGPRTREGGRQRRAPQGLPKRVHAEGLSAPAAVFGRCASPVLAHRRRGPAQQCGLQVPRERV